MGTEFFIGIGIGIAALVVIVVLRSIMKPKEVEMSSYSQSPSIESSQSSNAPVSFGDFSMTVDDVFMIKGRGLVVTGRVSSGSITVGQRVRLSSPDGATNIDSTVKGLEAFRKELSTANAGDNIGILLPELTKEQVKQGMEIRQIV